MSVHRYLVRYEDVVFKTFVQNFISRTEEKSARRNINTTEMGHHERSWLKLLK